MKCPHCQNLELAKDFYEKKINFRCERCGGRMMTVSGLRGLCGDRKLVSDLWGKANYGYVEEGALCPVCRKNMRQVTLPLSNTRIELDVCPRCQLIWFDPSELEQIPLPEPEIPPEIPQKARELLAMHQIKRDEARVNKVYESASSSDHTPDEGWKYIVAFLGFPVETTSIECRRRPIVTWSVAVLCLLVFVLTVWNLSDVIGEWGFIPNQWTRHGGLTLITSMFLHGGFWHLIGNLYFLLIFGDNVEDEFGRKKYVLLMITSGISALLLHALFTSSGNIPCVGASGFISGVVACYAICFPQARLSFVFFSKSLIFFIAGARNWFSIPAWSVCAIWIIFQVIMASIDRIGDSVAYMAHIGGFIPGVIFAVLHRHYSRQKACSDQTKSLDDLKSAKF